MKALHFAPGCVFVDSAGKLLLVTPVGVSGCLQYGPYCTLQVGTYTVRWRALVDPASLRSAKVDGSCCSVDVASGTNAEPFAQKSFDVEEIINCGGLLSLTFYVDTPKKVEFRLYSTGSLSLTIDPCREVVRDDGSLVYQDPEFLREYGIDSGGVVCGISSFLLENLDIFQEMDNWGVRFRLSPVGIVANFKGLAFYIENREDRQVVEECFVVNEYSFEIEADVCVIDIGMNVGLASLSFASRSNVREVHAFEPFNTPFERALRNFSLNVDLGKKIIAHNIGLSNENRTFAVNYNSAHTLGTSIRGAEGGVQTTIVVRDAAEVLRPIIESAMVSGLSIIAKVDCEGAEFAIFEVLEKHGLLDKIDVFLLEWHKWWDKTKSQRDLVVPLRARNFVVFDRTQDRNPHAGIIMAVRRSTMMSTGADSGL